MANMFLRWLAKRGSRRMIERDGAPYLERYFIYRGKKLSIYLHRFWASDPDTVHDHPWSSLSWIIKGGYREHFADGTYIDRKTGEKTLRDATTFHRVDLNKACPGSVWTLFFTWKRKRDWGFLTKNGWVAAKDYEEQPVDVYGRDYIFEGVLFPKFIRLGENDSNGAPGDRVPVDGQLSQEVQP